MIQAFTFATEPDWLAALRSAFLDAQDAALAARRTFHVALSGGRTPAPFYRLLAREALAWDRIEWWMGDERHVPVEDPANNGRMARDAFAEAGARFRFHPWDVELSPEDAARRYAERMRARIGDPPALDLALLGLGNDGHTASLFPESPALAITERDAAAAPGPPPHTRRLTLTYPALNRCREAWFLVSGRDKERMLQQLLQGDDALPAARIRGPRQKLFWRRGGGSPSADLPVRVAR